MGEPVRIADLAHDLIRLSGLEPGVDIEIEYTGVRPGEKLFEELVYDDETIYPTSHDKVMALNGQVVEPLAVERTLRRWTLWSLRHRVRGSPLRRKIPRIEV